jgi:hypothetical protein
MGRIEVSSIKERDELLEQWENEELDRLFEDWERDTEEKQAILAWSEKALRGEHN